MDVLVACHCANQTLAIAQFPDKQHVLNKRIYAKYGIRSLAYMEIQNCTKGRMQYVDWKSIPSNSIDRIWLQNCPLYSPKIRFLRILDGKGKLTKEEQQLLQDLFTEGWRLLRKGGTIVIPGSMSEERAYAFSRFAYLIGVDPHPWKLSIQSIKDAEFHIDDPAHEIDDQEYHIMWEKPGRRYTRKQRKI
jgi:hypothetical protein